VGDRYEIGRRLREEPWGGVWLARDLVLDAEVGLKLWPREDPAVDAVLESFREEARLGLKLRHPGILGVGHFGQDESFLYLVQEPFAGESLHEQLIRHRHFSLPQVVSILEQAALALAQAHEQGVVHQAFNPLQVLELDGEVRVANFTFPPPADEEVRHLELKAYLPPEVLRGEAVTPGGNVFALGVLGFRLAAGSLPYPLTFDEPFPYRLETPPVDLEEVPIPLQNLLLQCLSVEPEDRFPDAGAFLQQLHQLQGELPEEPWSARTMRSLRPAAARAGELLGRISGGLRPGAQKLREGLANLGPRLGSQGRRLWWSLGLVALMVLLVIYYKMPRETAPPRSMTPPPAVVKAGPAPAGGGPPMSEAREPAEAPGAVQPPGPPSAAPAPAGAGPGEVKAPPAEERYLVIAGAYPAPEPARALARRLRDKGIKAQVVKKGAGAKTRYVVQVGPLAGAQEADDLARRLKAKEKLSPKVQKITAPSPGPAASRRPRA
jgi:cell division septation protein DedD